MPHHLADICANFSYTGDNEWKGAVRAFGHCAEIADRVGIVRAHTFIDGCCFSTLGGPCQVDDGQMPANSRFIASEVSRILRNCVREMWWESPDEFIRAQTFEHVFLYAADGRVPHTELRSDLRYLVTAGRIRASEAQRLTDAYLTDL